MRRTALICTSAGGSLVSLDDAKKQVRVENDDDDEYLTALGLSATAELDGADGSLKRALLTQTWKLVLPGFQHRLHGRGGFWPQSFEVAFHRRDCEQAHRIELPLPPLQSISSVTYIDPTGTLQTLDPSLYRVVNCGTDPSCLLPAYGQSWPSVRSMPDAVTITMVCGYGDSPSTVPPTLLHAAKLLVGLFYENREAALVADRAAAIELPYGVERLIYKYRILRY